METVQGSANADRCVQSGRLPARPGQKARTARRGDAKGKPGGILHESPGGTRRRWYETLAKRHGMSCDVMSGREFILAVVIVPVFIVVGVEFPPVDAAQRRSSRSSR